MTEVASQRSWPRPRVPRLPGWLAYRMQPLVAPRPLYRRLALLLERIGPARRIFTRAELATKSALFGCRMCGQCALPVTGYACPMTCPKQLRNGPCGGVGADGSCEVYPDSQCVWVVAIGRAERSGHIGDLTRLHRPGDQRAWGQSSWVNYWLGRDDQATAGLGCVAGAGSADRPGPVLLPMPVLRPTEGSEMPA
jgi:hypothetical protein